jgi:aspartate/methionine/tyrosine aminotransferase
MNTTASPANTRRGSRVATRTLGFTESVIREMTRLAAESGALNLAQGFPDFPAPDVLKDAACAAIRGDVNQYAVTWGTPRLRRALAAKYARDYGMEVDEASEITITCGATEAMAAVLLALIDPADEVIVFDPFYENYGPDAVLCGGVPRFVPLAADGPLDLDRVRAAVRPSTRAMIINTPNNPTGRVLDRAELEGLAAICIEHDLFAITDEIYEHILYDGVHIPIATLDGMRERTVTISGASKTYSVTGWRIGWIVAPAALTEAIRKVHDFLTVGAPAPLQEACATAIETLGQEYYAALLAGYRERRDVLYRGLVEAGFRCTPPSGAYYILADFSALSEEQDDVFARRLARGAGGVRGVASVPGSSFFHRPEDGRQFVRFAFCKRVETLKEASAALPPLLQPARS